MTGLGTGLFTLMTLLSQTSIEAEPYVTILSSNGTVIQQKTDGIIAYTAELQVEIGNNLSLPVDQLELEIRLQYENVEIPGWRIIRRFNQAQVAAKGQTIVSIKESLVPQRRQFDLHKIQYQVEIVRYRVKPFQLDTLVRLIQSPSLSDQSAALLSLDLVAKNHREIIRTQLAKEELVRFFAPKSVAPQPRIALELLLALRAVAAIEIAEILEPLLVWFSFQNEEQWGTTLIDLVQRVKRDSLSDERRLRIIPPWANSTLSQDHRANTVLRELLISCVLTLSDSAIPKLVLTKHLSKNQSAKKFASEILALSGRRNPQEQFAMTEPSALREMVDIAEKISTRPYVDEIISLLSSPVAELRKASREALIRMNDQSLMRLAQKFKSVRAWNLHEKKLVFEILQKQPLLQTMLALELGLEPMQDEALSQFMKRIELMARVTQDNETDESIRAAFLDFEAGRYEQSVNRLDKIFQLSPELLRKRSGQIIDMYVKYAELLYDSGDFDEAKRVLSTVSSFSDSEKVNVLMANAIFALADGYVSLGQHRRAYEELRELPSQFANRQRARMMKTKILNSFLDVAISRNNFSKAKQYIDQIESLGVSSKGLTQRKILLTVLENLVSVGVFAALFFGVLLAAVLNFWKRLEQNQMNDLQT